jgi:cytochrome c
MIKLLGSLTLAAALILPAIHPWGPVKEQHSPAPLPNVPALARACQNCHSEQTTWPPYAYLPLASWALEKDVADARQHLNFSHWERYSDDEKQDLLARIGAEVKSRRMPLPRYLLLHPDARLSNEDVQAIYDWTREQRRILRAHRSSPTGD